jgi:N-acetyl sugar amidotransferase
MPSNYRICSRCVMDTSDPEISFDDHGVCNHCRNYDDNIRNHVLSGESGARFIASKVEEIKRAGAGKKYDCIVGVSGGVDSTFVAYKVKQLGLRPLAVHLDNGWNSELAVNNIHEALTRLKIDLHTHVIDWEQFKDLQLAFLRSSTPDSEIPSDHAIFSLMRLTAQKMGVRYIISGFNRRTESHLPQSWSQGHTDWKYIRSVHRAYGKLPLDTYPHMTLLQLVRWSKTQEWIDILNYLDYVKKDALVVLERELGWRNYGGKHFESLYTRFYQGYILPKKFGYDKRRCHLSSLICSGEITRDAALAELKSEPYPVALQLEDREYVLSKFGLSEKEFDALMAAPPRSFWDFPSYEKFFRGPWFRAAQKTKRFIARPFGFSRQAAPKAVGQRTA